MRIEKHKEFINDDLHNEYWIVSNNPSMGLTLKTEEMIELYRELYLICVKEKWNSR